MVGFYVDQSNCTLLGNAAEGSIQADQMTHRLLDEMTRRVSEGEFHYATDILVPCDCIDGRCGTDTHLRPKSAGGTLSLAVADDLLYRDYEDDGTTAGMVANVFRRLQDRGYVVGDHTDDNADGDASGCGANDKLPLIYDIITRKADKIRSLASIFSIDVDDDTHSAIVSGATRRTNFSSGRAVLDTMLMYGKEDNIDTLHGGHEEVVAIINKRNGTTLDRNAVLAQFGAEYEAFNIDAWSFEAGARALYPDADAAIIQRTVGALIYYNLATALVLCGPNMRIVTVERS